MKTQCFGTVQNEEIDTARFNPYWPYCEQLQSLPCYCPSAVPHRKGALSQEAHAIQLMQCERSDHLYLAELFKHGITDCPAPPDGINYEFLPPFFSQKALFRIAANTPLAQRCTGAFLNARRNGTPADAPPDEPPLDGWFTFTKGRVDMKDQMVYGELRPGGSYEYELGYVAGPGDLVWMEQCDRNYLARLLREGTLLRQEPAVWYLWTRDDSPSDIGAWWMGYIRIPNITEMLAAIKPQDVAEFNRMQEAVNEALDGGYRFVFSLCSLS